MDEKAASRKYYAEREKEYLDCCEWENTAALTDLRIDGLKKLADELVGDGDIKLAEKTLKEVDACIAKLEKIKAAREEKHTAATIRIEPKPKKKGGKK